MTHRAATPTGSNSWQTTKTKAIYDRNRYRSRIYPSSLPSSSSSSQNCAYHTSRRDENTNSPNTMNNDKNSRSKGRERMRTFYRRQRGRVPSSSSSLFAEGVSDTDDVLILYTKPGCCLCEGLEEKLKAVLELAQQRESERETTTGDVDNNSSQNNHVALDLREYALEIRDVSLKKEWADAHAGEIPVLFVGKRGDADDAQTASKVKRPTPRVSIERLKLDLEKHLVSLASNSTREDNASKTNEDDTRGGGGWKVISAKPF